MVPESGKKIIILYILQILRKYTDENHTMTQQQIADKLLSEYGIEVNRATIKRNLSDLIDAGYGISYKEVTRYHTNGKTGEKEENTIYTDLYYEHDFTESELHMLIDGLLFSRSVPYKPRKDLIEKLGNLSSSYFSKRMRHVHSMSADAPQNPGLFYNIEVLDEAIAEGKQVEITYGYYGTDLKLHKAVNEDGSEKVQLLNPYQLVASEGRYYLICNKDNYDNVVKLQDYVYQNVNMFAGQPETVEFEIPKSAVSLVIDFFGKHPSFHENRDGTVSCTLKVSRAAMRHWASQFATVVRVVSPPELAEEVREEIRKAARNYGME